MQLLSAFIAHGGSMSGRRAALQASNGEMSIPEHRYPERAFVRVPLMLSCKTKVCVENRLCSRILVLSKPVPPVEERSREIRIAQVTLMEIKMHVLEYQPSAVGLINVGIRMLPRTLFRITFPACRPHHEPRRHSIRSISASYKA